MGNPGTQPGGERAHPGLGQPQGVGGSDHPLCREPSHSSPPRPGQCSGVGFWGGLGGLATPLVVLYTEFMHSTLLYLSALQKWQCGFRSFYILFRFSCNCAYTQLFLFTYSFILL